MLYQLWLKTCTSSRDAIHYHSLNYTDQSTSEEIDTDKCLVNLAITLYTLFKPLDNFINSHWTCSNDSEKNPSTLIHAKDNAYKSREKYLISFDVAKIYWEKFKLEELNLYETNKFPRSRMQLLHNNGNGYWHICIITVMAIGTYIQCANINVMIFYLCYSIILYNIVLYRNTILL